MKTIVIFSNLLYLVTMTTSNTEYIIHTHTHTHTHIYIHTVIKAVSRRISVRELNEKVDVTSKGKNEIKCRIVKNLIHIPV